MAAHTLRRNSPAFGVKWRPFGYDGGGEIRAAGRHKGAPWWLHNNTLTGPQWLMGNRAKWLLSDSAPAAPATVSCGAGYARLRPVWPALTAGLGKHLQPKENTSVFSFANIQYFILFHMFYNIGILCERSLSSDGDILFNDILYTVYIILYFYYTIIFLYDTDNLRLKLWIISVCVLCCYVIYTRQRGYTGWL